MSNTLTPEGEARAERESMAGLLAKRMVESGQQATSISVAELHRVLLPYHECRDRLGLASKGEYDVALLGLLSDPGAIRVDDDLAQAVRRELATPEPGLAVLKNFAAARLEMRTGAAKPEAVPEPDAAADDMGSPDAADDAGSPDADDAGSPAAAAKADSPATVRADESTHSAGAGEAAESVPSSCLGCGGTLPIGPDISFCPHCGADQTTPRCADCNSELEPGWKYCPRCGQQAEG